jgi:hypothetical protein
VTYRNLSITDTSWEKSLVIFREIGNMLDEKAARLFRQWDQHIDQNRTAVAPTGFSG